MNKEIILSLLIFLFLPVHVFAETVILKSGNTVEGKIIEKTDKAIKVDISGIPITYYFEEIESIDGQAPIVPTDNVIKAIEKDNNQTPAASANNPIKPEESTIEEKQEKTISVEDKTVTASEESYATNTNIKIDPDVEKAADIYCATFQARNESGLGKPLDPLQPRVMTVEDAGSHGQQFQQIIVGKMAALMKKYKWDSGKLGEECEKADERIKKESFRKKVRDLLRKRGDCHLEYLD
ncbi:MAG: hypothetical protein PHQ96_00475 [Candidatus Omnitrophica bacterium]|nr:hypothetical protein [Candidatus Omnitrophota bacterium]